MTIRHCSLHAADLVNYSLFYISSNISVFLRNLNIFYTSQFFPSSAHMSPWILYYFLLSLHFGQSCRQCFIVSVWFPYAAFLKVDGCSFLDIKLSASSFPLASMYAETLHSVSCFPWFQSSFSMSYI